MTREEAEKLARIFGTVDHGCSVCIKRVCLEANVAGLGWFFDTQDEDYSAPRVSVHEGLDLLSKEMQRRVAYDLERRQGD
jgi:hypothetical protein